MKKQKTRKKFNVLKIIIPVVLAGLIIWGIFVLMGELSKNSNSSTNNTGNGVVEEEEDPIKSEDPGDTDTVTDEKDTSGGSDKTDTPTKNPDTGLNNATVELTNASVENGQVFTSGQVTNVTEPSGTCTYTFTNTTDGKTITETTGVLPSASYTVCTAISIDKANFSAGTWKVVLKYESTYSKGESASESFKIN
ncbi:MAG: hypothetical protein ACK5MU_01805 [Candidatus Saccharimonadales bacterium]